MDAAMYRVSHSDELITPVLLYYKDYIIPCSKEEPG